MPDIQPHTDSRLTGRPTGTSSGRWLSFARAAWLAFFAFAALALVYFGSVTLLQSIFASISDQQSTVAIVLSTLAIAALFIPLRRRMQNFIDRRFFRRNLRRRGARLAEFGATARDEVELEKLAGRLVEVVRETMQPERVGLWLRKK